MAERIVDMALSQKIQAVRNGAHATPIRSPASIEAALMEPEASISKLSGSANAATPPA